jgi:flagellar hook-associated protein 2
MVQVYKLPSNQLNSQKTTLQTQQTAWKDINSRLASLDMTLTALKTAATWTTTSAASSNTSCVMSTGGSGALAGIYALNVTQIAKAEVVVSKQTSNAALETEMGVPYEYTSGTPSSNWDFSINGKNIVVTSSSAESSPTLSDICNSINNTQGVGVTASLIQVDNSAHPYRISITGNTGAANQIAFADPNGTLENLGLTLDGEGHAAAFDGTIENGGISQQAQDANFTVNTVNITSSTNKVTTAIQGVTLNLNSTGSATITVETDTSVAEKAVQAFVDQYNSVNSFISDKLSYDSTTKKAGDLFGDSTLQAIQARLRNILGSVINSSTSSYKTLSEVGISTSSANFGKDATLTFDTAKFVEALGDQPQSVANLFSAPYNGIIPADDEGLGNSLHAYLYPVIQFGAQTQNSFDNRIKDVTNRIRSFEDRVTQYQDMLTLKFAKLETLLSGLNSQSTWLTAQINSMTASSSINK